MRRTAPSSRRLIAQIPFQRPSTRTVPVGRAHQVHAHRLPARDQPGELGGAERAEPAPQPHVGRERRLRLQADQAFDRVDGRQVCALQQHLPGQRGPVQRPGADRFGQAGRSHVKPRAPFRKQ
jgi:hypothetical protein